MARLVPRTDIDTGAVATGVNVAGTVVVRPAGVAGSGIDLVEALEGALLADLLVGEAVAVGSVAGAGEGRQG